MDAWLGRWLRPLLILGIVLNFSGLWVTVMEPDAALYATISRNMAESGNWRDLVAGSNEDWLDKPHLPFWVTALSFRLLGVGTVAYKLPALLFWSLALVYTYLFATRFYDRRVAGLAVLFVVTAQHLILSNDDVRAEPYLVGTIIGSLYHFARSGGRGRHVIAGALLAALAVMTKGLFVLIPVFGGLAVHWALRRQWSELWSPRWWAALALVLVFITPELYSLYAQFDLHPEKLVYGAHGVSGIRFFFWDSQFGRFLNTGPIRGHSSPLFFVHTTLWAFLPWSLWLCAAVGDRLVKLRSPAPIAEGYTWGAAGLTFLVFSLSRFQLAHYLNVVFPFFAIIAAQWVAGLSSPRARVRAARAQLVVVAFMLGAALLLVWIASPSRTAHALGFGFIALAAGAAALLFRGGSLPQAVGWSFGAALAVNVAVNAFFYPAVLRYQAGSEAAFFVNSLPARRVAQFAVDSYALDFYSRERVQRWDAAQIREAAESEPLYVFLPAERIPELEAAGVHARKLRAFPSYFRVTRLTPAFLNPSTRATTLREMAVAEVTARPSG